MPWSCAPRAWTACGGLRRFGLWLDTERPRIESLAELTRADLVAFMQDVQQFRKIKHPDEPLSPAYRADIISVIAVFFRYAALFEWDDVPARPLITRADMPRRIQRVPRFIPAHQLDPVVAPAAGGKVSVQELVGGGADAGLGLLALLAGQRHVSPSGVAESACWSALQAAGMLLLQAVFLAGGRGRPGHARAGVACRASWRGWIAVIS